MKKLILTLLLPLLFISCSEDFTVLGPISERNAREREEHDAAVHNGAAKDRRVAPITIDLPTPSSPASANAGEGQRVN